MTTIATQYKAASLIARKRSYIRLYQAVILRALQDLAQDGYQDGAREWLLSSESDYAFATAGISRDTLRQQMI